MKPVNAVLLAAAILSGCGQGAEESSAFAATEPAGLSQFPGSSCAPATLDRADVMAARRAFQTIRHSGDFEPAPGLPCSVTRLAPVAWGTVQYVSRNVWAEVVSSGQELQSSYLWVNRPAAVTRRGVAEFAVPGDVAEATLRFREVRGWVWQPQPIQTHAIVAYAGNLELEPTDFWAAAIPVGRFYTSASSEPLRVNAYDVTRAVLALGSRAAFRFEPIGDDEASTAFTDVRLDVARCARMTHPE